jgi:hypothetical protein
MIRPLTARGPALRSPIAGCLSCGLGHGAAATGRRQTRYVVMTTFPKSFGEA